MKGLNANAFSVLPSTWLRWTFGTTLILVILPFSAEAAEEPRSPNLLAQNSEAKEVLLENVGQLEPGDATLEDGTLYDEFTLEGQAGEVVSITLESLEFDTYLLLISPTGETLAENDNFDESNYNSWLTITLPDTGTYQVLANAVDTQAQGQYALTIVSEEAEPSFSQVVLKQSEARELHQIGLEILEQGNFQDAIPYFEQSLDIYQEIGDRQNEGKLLDTIGGICDSLGNYREALDYYEQSLVIAQETGDRQGEGVVLSKLGGIYFKIENHQIALDNYEASLVVFQETANLYNEGVVLNNIGNVHLSQGNYQIALDYLEHSLDIYRSIGSRSNEAVILNDIGWIYYRLSQYQDALEFHELSLVAFQEIEDEQGEARAIYGIGNAYDMIGQYQNALSYYEISLEISQEIGDRYIESASINNIGFVYFQLGLRREALEYFEKSLLFSQEINYRHGEGVSLNNIGSIYDDLDRYQEALDYYLQALEIFQELDDLHNQSVQLNNIGGVYERTNRYQESLTFYRQSLVTRQEIGDLQGEGESLNNIGGIHDRLGEYQEALNYYERALIIRQEVGDRAGEANTLNNLGFNRLSTREFAQAEDRFVAAIAILESLRLGGLTEDQRIALVETQRDTFQGLQQALISQNKIDAALEISERGRARVFLEELERRFDPDALAQLESVPPPKISEIREIARAQNATLVQYSIVRNQDLYIWVVQPTGATEFRQVSLQNQNLDVTQLVNATRTSMGVLRSIVEWGEIENPAGNDETAASATLNSQLQQLHQLLIDPIAEFLPTDPTASVIFIPQDELFLVPFAALQAADGSYLIDRHTILTAPAIQVLASTQAQQQQVRQANLQETLVIGDPTMPPLSLIPGESPDFLQPLPGAEAEAISIANLLDTSPLLGEAATKSSVVQQMTNARIIHLATHGILDESQGLNGGVVLAADGTGEFNDGLLTAAEIAQMDLNAELVVLSACNTGQGRITGDGVIGLSRSLILAGVPSVVVSLWAVPDAPTGELMVEFYRQLEQTDNKAQALRQAMLNIREEYPNPIAWAAFTLIGEAE